MNTLSSRWIRVVAIIALGFLARIADTAPPDHPAHHHETIATAPLPGGSLYHLSISLETETGDTVAIHHFRGSPLLVTMFYTHCSSVCPMLTANLQRLDRDLSPAQRSKLHVLMVSLDGRRDTPAELAHFATVHAITDSRWTLARATDDDVRLLAAALGIRFRELPDHSFNHSAVITLLTADGDVLARTSDLFGPDELFAKVLAASLTP